MWRWWDAMATAMRKEAEATEGMGAAQHTWRQRGERLVRRLFCCTCRKSSAPTPMHTADEEDRESVRIMVDDLGMDNPGFNLIEGDPSPRRMRGMGRSASSVSACRQAWQKRKLTPLSSLPLQHKAGQSSLNSEEEVDALLLEGGPGGRVDGTLLTLPLINLIPPTPSDVIEDDQFFDINSEEDSVAHTSGSECVDSMGSQALGDQDSITDQAQMADGWDSGLQKEASSEGPGRDEEKKQAKCPAVPDTTGVDHNNPDQAKRQAKHNFLKSSYQVAPLPEYPRKRSFNTGINLLEFTEQNLDDLNNKDANDREIVKAELRLLPLCTRMELRKPATRTYSLGDTVSRSHTFYSVTKASEEVPEDEGSPRQRRITVASYIPQSKDSNGNFAKEQHSGGSHAQSLAELDTEGVCRWFTNIGLQKCLPFIRGANLCGSHITTIDPNILDVLHVSDMEEREKLLSAIYRELHPPDTNTQKLDTLLESIGPYNIDKFTAALVSMTKSKSSPHVNCVSSNRSSFRFRDRIRHSNFQRNSHLIEITIHALEQIVHLRTPKETTVGKVMDSCLKMLGVTDNKEHFSLRNKEGSSTEFSVNQQIGDLLGSEKRLLELHLCKKDNLEVLQPKMNGSHGISYDNLQGKLRSKEEKIRELNQHVDSLQNVIHQVQELHQSLVSFCGELRNMGSELSLEDLCLSDVETQLRQVQGRVHEKQLNVQTMQDRLCNVEASKNRRPEVHLLDKMKLDCQIFKEEVSIIHLNRQVTRLKLALKDIQTKDHNQRKSTTLGQLVSPHCPAVLLATQEMRNAEGEFGFTVRLMEGAGLVVKHVENSQLCLNDRLVEVNGVSVLESGEDELSDLLLRRPSARIVVLRKPPPLPPKPGHASEPICTRAQGGRPPPVPVPHCRITT